MNNIPTAQTIINSSELPRGYELSNYVIERKLGHGGFGITYLARETATNRAVVIKENFPQVCSQRHTTNLTVGPSSAENKELYEWALSRFLDEAKVLIRLSHPGIVPVLTAFNALGTAYYVMPLVEGKEIHKAAPSPQTINEAWLRPVLQKLLEALAYLHGEGLLHRDIKPSNILMCADGSPLLIDFGTVRSSDAPHTLTRIGYPGFSPKEQFLARGKNGPWNDLYSLGATCYYLITGEVPQDFVERLAVDELLPLASRKELQGRFSEEFLSAIDKALRISYKDRWQSAQEWMEKLAPAKTQEQPKAIEIQAPVVECLPAQQANDVSGRQIGKLVGIVIGGQIGTVIGMVIGWLIGWGVGGLIGLFIGMAMGWLIGRKICVPLDRAMGWLIGILIGWEIGILIGWDIGYLISWYISWLISGVAGVGIGVVIGWLISRKIYVPLDRAMGGLIATLISGAIGALIGGEIGWFFCGFDDEFVGVGIGVVIGMVIGWLISRKIRVSYNRGIGGLVGWYIGWYIGCYIVWYGWHIGWYIDWYIFTVWSSFYNAVQTITVICGLISMVIGAVVGGLVAQKSN